jgi:hypothetical protein
MRRHAAALFVSLLVGPLATLPWNGDDAIFALRARLRARGYTAEVAAGPMIALWSEDAPVHPLSANAALPPSTRNSVSGAYLVITDAGDWWVWTNGLDSGPLTHHPSLPE